MKVRFNGSTFIVYKFISVQAFSLFTGRSDKVFYGMATQVELS